MTRYRPPRDCPVCSSRLQVTQLGCPNCGTGLTGAFESCEFCGLDQADRDLLRVFLASRGNMKELERHLGVSYPTARARFEDLLRKLGLAGGAGGAGTGAATAAGSGAASAQAPAGQNGGTAGTVTARSTSAAAGPGARAAAGDPRLEMLRAVAAGTVDVAEASDVLGGPTPPEPSSPGS